MNNKKNKKNKDLLIKIDDKKPHFLVYLDYNNEVFFIFKNDK